MKRWDPVVRELVELIREHGWEDDFKQAIWNARKYNIPEIEDIKDLDDYLNWLNDQLRWVPTEDRAGSEVVHHLGKTYFILAQPPVDRLQNSVVPHPKAPPLTPLSAWLKKYIQELGKFLDTPESLTPESLRSFYESPTYNMSDYIQPHGGWKSYNQLFARHVKPGYRPVAAPCDPAVIMSPADATFAGQWEIRTDSEVTIKGLHWTIGELLEGSPYRHRFVNGMFMHAFLNANDYHRQHAPVGGTVVEARMIPGHCYLQVVAEPVAADPNGGHRLKPVRTIDAPDDAGYQFAQARGLIVMDTSIGLVAILPVGMGQVESVILTAEEGVTLRKGEEISYFQFGGSDIILLFEAKTNISFTAQVGVHYKMGTRIAQAFPVI